MTDIAHALKTIRPLDDSERLDAEHEAVSIVIQRVGKQPEPADFMTVTHSKYPPIVTRIVGALLALVFVGASSMSLFVIFTAGRDYFLYGGLTSVNGAQVLAAHGGINDFNQGVVSGFATFLLGEFLVILSTVAAMVFYTGRARLWFIVPIVLGLLMTLVGNWTVKQPHDLFGVLLAVTPTVATLFLGLVGERLLFASIEARHAADSAYQDAIAQYAQKTANPQLMDGYRPAVANALKKAIYAANVKGTGATLRRELMATFNKQVWSALVMRELSADNWFNPDAQPVEVVTMPQPERVTVEPERPAELPAPMTTEVAGLPPRKPTVRKRKTSLSDLKTVPMFDDVKE